MPTAADASMTQILDTWVAMSHKVRRLPVLTTRGNGLIETYALGVIDYGTVVAVNDDTLINLTRLNVQPLSTSEGLHAHAFSGVHEYEAPRMSFR